MAKVLKAESLVTSAVEEAVLGGGLIDPGPLRVLERSGSRSERSVHIGLDLGGGDGAVVDADLIDRA